MSDPDRFATRHEASAVGPYELARIFLTFPSTDPDPVHELAVTAALAKLLSGWVGLHVHKALTAGVPLDQVAEAAGQHGYELEGTWRLWAALQLQHARIDQAAFDTVAAVFEHRAGR